MTARCGDDRRGSAPELPEQRIQLLRRRSNRTRMIDPPTPILYEWQRQAKKAHHRVLTVSKNLV